MGYAALGVAAVVLVGLVVATAHRGRRWWFDRPFMSAYRAVVVELGLTEQEQRRLERATRGGREVPPAQVHASACFAEAVLGAQGGPGPVWARRAATAGFVLLVIGGVLGVCDLFVTGFSWSVVFAAGYVVLGLGELLYVPRSRERLLAHLRSAVDRDVVRSPDHQVGGSPPTGGGR